MTDPVGCIAIIPARGGSKGIVGKNLRPVGGTPLVARAALAALAAATVDLVVVSTDDDDIAAVAEAAGATVVRRPDDLAGDTASSESAVLHALDVLAASGTTATQCLLIQCTSPFIEPADIDATAALVRSGGFDAAFTATEHHGFLWRSDGDGMVGVNHDASVRQRRQDRDPEVLETGAVYAFDVAGFRAAGHRFFGRVGAHVVPRSRSIEIDEPEDLALVEAMAWARAASADDHVEADGGAADGRGLPAVVGAVVFDFDGVMTDNRALLLEDGTEGVYVDRGDGAGIEQLRATGVAMLVITKETNPVALRRCEKLRLECAHDISDKWPVLEAWLAARSLPAEQVVYVGNDHNDVECLERVGCGVAVADAHPSALAAADLVLRATGVAMLVITKETNPVALRRCEKLRLECAHDISDKWPVLEAWLAARSLPAEEVVYVGNDLNDVECLERVGCGVAVADAHPSALAAADLVLRRAGGHGAVRELADLLIAQRLGAATSGGPT